MIGGGGYIYILHVVVASDDLGSVKDILNVNSNDILDSKCWDGSFVATCKDVQLYNWTLFFRIN